MALPDPFPSHRLPIPLAVFRLEMATVHARHLELRFSTTPFPTVLGMFYTVLYLLPASSSSTDSDGPEALVVPLISSIPRFATDFYPPSSLTLGGSSICYRIGSTGDSGATVLVPLVFGLAGLVVFVTYEATIATHPIVPLALMANATSISGYVQSFCIGLNTLAVIYFFPVYFQACKGVSPVLSGIYTLSLCAFAPASILAGLSVKATSRYRPQMWIAWVIVLVAMGLLSASTTYGIGTSLGYLVLLGLGSGYVLRLFVDPRTVVFLVSRLWVLTTPCARVLYAAAVYPIQANVVQ
ncbi:hypothetical protein OG21DRAFT_1488770 [Imleria badia]|nr:hypothetical protein OG21DRAFT_1488770 [Imleria badia]